MGRRRIECRVGRVGALWWRDIWPAARAAFKTCGGGVTIVISTGVRRCGRWECSRPKAGRLGAPWKAETADMPRQKMHWMGRDIGSCILGCCGADGQHLFLLHQKFAEHYPARWRPSGWAWHVSYSSESTAARVIRSGWTRLVDSPSRCLGVSSLLVDAGVREAQPRTT